MKISELPEQGYLVLHVVFDNRPQWKPIHATAQELITAYSTPKNLVIIEFCGTHVVSSVYNGNPYSNSVMVGFRYRLYEDTRTGFSKARSHMRHLLMHFMNVKELKSVKSVYLYRRDYIDLERDN